MRPFGPALGSALLLLAAAAPGAAGPEPVIQADNEAGVTAAELDSILRDFRRWAARVYAYNHAHPGPVTLRLTRKVPFGFYRDGVVLLPPNTDRAAMIEDWVHELTHHAIGRDSSFFFREGTATHTVDALFAQDARVPQGWPYFGQGCDAWVTLFLQRRQLMPLAEALAWPHYLGGTPEQDFHSWQTYLTAGSFVGWYIAGHGYDAFRAAFRAERPAEDSAELEKEWLAWIEDKKLPDFDPAAVLPKVKRYRNYAERLKPRESL